MDQLIYKFTCIQFSGADVFFFLMFLSSKYWSLPFTLLSTRHDKLEIGNRKVNYLEKVFKNAHIHYMNHLKSDTALRGLCLNCRCVIQSLWNVKDSADLQISCYVLDNGFTKRVDSVSAL